MFEIRYVEQTDYTKVVLVFILTYLGLLIFHLVVVNFISTKSKKTKFKWDDLISDILNRLGFSFYFFVSLLASSFYINFGSYTKYVSSGFLAIFTFYAIRALSLVVRYIANRYIEIETKKDKAFNSSVVQVLKSIAIALVWVFGTVLVLENLGYNVSSLVAALGIGGIAIGFALQSVLKDLFAYFSIFFDKPFVIGDFITFKDTSGVVEKIGIKSTKLRQLRGEQVIVPNTTLTETEVNNFQKLHERRVVLKLGVTYETSPKKLKTIPALVEKSVVGVKKVKFDRAHFYEYGDYSLNFEVVFYVLSEDYNLYMDKLQEVNFNILDNFNSEGIKFAYPTQTVFIDK